jgi:hypothetical protein
MGQVINFTEGVSQDLNERLISAACGGDEAKLTELLDKGANPNYRDALGNTALHSAYQWGHKRLTKILINRGACVDLGDQYQRTLLSLAAEKGDLETTSYLIAKGGNVNSVDSRFRSTPLSRAAVKGRDVIVRLLLSSGADPGAVDIMGETPLSRAHKWGRHDIAHIMETYQGRAPAVYDKEQESFSRFRNLVKSTVRDELKNHVSVQVREVHDQERNPQDNGPGANDLDASEILGELKRNEEGKDGSFQEYEKTCMKAISYCFGDYLVEPACQLQSQDLLDKMDLIFSIRDGSPFWDRVRQEFNTRYVVVEAKNHKDPPGQKEIESLQQYLYPKAMRSFGILMARFYPPKRDGNKNEHSAWMARRRAWHGYGCMIVVLDDNRVIQMVEMKSKGEDPTPLLNHQIDQFLRTLTP